MPHLKEFRIVQDSREKKPLPFPRSLELLSYTASPCKQIPVRVNIQVISTTLQAADYILDDHPTNAYLGVGASTACIIERKYSLDELHTNIFNRKRRASFIRCLDRMAEGWNFPLLLLEGTLSSLYNNTRPEVHGGLVMDEVMRLCLSRGVGLQIAEGNTQSKRRKIAEHAARFLFNGALTHAGN